MRWLNRLLGRKEPSKELLSALGLEQGYQAEIHQHVGIEFRRTSLSEIEGKIPLSDARIGESELSILVCGSDKLSGTHEEMIQSIRKQLPNLIDHSIDAVLKETGSDLQNFTKQVHGPCIVMGSDGEEFNGSNWSFVFEWGDKGLGYHVEFDHMDLVRIWAGD